MVCPVLCAHAFSVTEDSAVQHKAIQPIMVQGIPAHLLCWIPCV